MGGFRVCAAFIALIFAFTATGNALAALGQPRASIARDRARMAPATQSSKAIINGVEHRMTLPNGTVVKQIENDAGAIVAVTWRGPGRPDLKQLLGMQYFATYQETARVARTRIRMRRAPRVHRNDLVIETGGHSGSFWGIAYLPGQLPSGFDPNAF